MPWLLLFVIWSKRIIVQETPRKPLSDKMICKMITDEGLNLAGLIADKYREW